MLDIANMNISVSVIVKIEPNNRFSSMWIFALDAISIIKAPPMAILTDRKIPIRVSELILVLFFVYVIKIANIIQ